MGNNIVKLYIENDVIIAYATIGDIGNSIEHEFESEEDLICFEENFKPHKFLYIDGVIKDNPEYESVLQKESQHEQITTEIALLKSQLAETDYRIIKCHEYNLVGMDLPYDIQVLHADRERIREQIREREMLI